jgi:hypothetical protein
MGNRQRSQVSTDDELLERIAHLLRAKPKWVTIKKAAELTGYTEKAIEAKRAEGVWLEGVIWRKGPDGRIMISTEGIDAWVEGQAYAPQAEPQSR